MQYTADVSERLLITHCKHTFKGTNHVDFWEEQCVRILDRQEKARLFDLYSLLRSNGISLINEAVGAEESFMSGVMTDSHPETAWLSRVLPGEETRIGGPRLRRNLFTSKGVLSVDSTAAFLLNVTPHISSITIEDAAQMYRLEDFWPALSDYGNGLTHEARRGRRIGRAGDDIGFEKIKVWVKVRIQLESIHHGHIVMPAETVQCLPPSDDAPHGICDTVLADNPASLSTAIDGMYFFVL
jgi:hypothetical protein